MSNGIWSRATLFVFAAVALAGCLPKEAGVNAPSQTPVQSNSAPAIGGTPVLQVVVGTTYLFQPSALDSDGDALSFSATGLPAWASINTGTGLVSGTPGSAHVGMTSLIVITVSDGAVSTSLPGFQVTVVSAPVNTPPVPPPTATGTAALSWSAPTQNTDGSSLTDLAGYRIYHGTNAGALSEVVELAGTATTSHMYNALASGTHYFAVTAFNTAGRESALSGVGSKIIP
jgi:Putative Ig domain